ncbi:hypothetical protein [Sphingomonas sp. 3-13AW]|uniref:hypothetical protein n=1 Tax=Sphingomonas sp. 3-13AW TaxID=3050450 RepID=UPI003BB5277E
MPRKPLPADVEFQVLDAPTVRKLLADAGIAKHKTALLTFDQLHALMTENVGAEQGDEAERIVIVSERNGMQLNLAAIYGLRKLRPDRDLSHGFNVFTKRSRAIEVLGIGAALLDLPDLDIALSNKDGQDHVIIRDEDYRNVMKAFNEIVSGMPHGRSPKYD